MISTRHPRVRVYQMLRSAHLERAHAGVPASLLYVSRRYDFDEQLLDGLDVIQAGLLRTVAVLARSRISVIEVNEPLVRARLVRTATAIAIVKWSAALRRHPTSIVAYAIENLDPMIHRPGAGAGSRVRVRAWARREIDRRLSRWVARRVDRIAFGTPAAADLYHKVLGKQLGNADKRTILALPAPCECLADTTDLKKQGVVFLGSFEQRKGLTNLLEAWPSVRLANPGVPLTLLGKGPLELEAKALAGEFSNVSVRIDPSRSIIHDVLRSAAVLVLVSQRRPRWREQVGLPIVEGLAHGCRVVSTSETGLASWLGTHGHVVLAPDVDASGLASAILAAFDPAVMRRARRDLLADLPDVDGRLAADEWLMLGSTAPTQEADTRR